MLPQIAPIVNTGLAHALMGSLLSSISGTQPPPGGASKNTKSWSDINDIVNAASPLLMQAGPVGLAASFALPLVMQAFKPKVATGGTAIRGQQIANNVPVTY